VASAHPLDGLSAEEMTETVSILKAEGKTTDDACFPLIELKEPDKPAVLAWRPAQPAPRLVTVNVKEAAGTFKGEVDLAARKVVSWAPAAGETMILLEEFLGAMDVALANPEMQEALSKRGLTKEQVFCIPLTAGAFGEPEEHGRRLMKVPCLVSPSGSNFYAKPIEGLFAVIDLNKKEVVRVVDTGVRPVSVDAWGYTDEENAAREGSLRPVANPAGLAQPKGPDYTIDGGQVTWDMWRFRLRVDKRPGVVLSQIEARDGDQWRSVLYQAHLSEVFVPYMDPDQGWYWRTYAGTGAPIWTAASTASASS
jgi:primary-amine oxidase